jgi:hypothetical protein
MRYYSRPLWMMAGWWPGDRLDLTAIGRYVAEGFAMCLAENWARERLRLARLD